MFLLKKKEWMKNEIFPCVTESQRFWLPGLGGVTVWQCVCHTLPGRWNLPLKRPWLFRSCGLSTFLIPIMLPRAIILKVQGFWLFCSISACFLCMTARLSLLITWNTWITRKYCNIYGTKGEICDLIYIILFIYCICSVVCWIYIYNYNCMENYCFLLCKIQYTDC